MAKKTNGLRNLDSSGHEVLDPTPMAPAVGYNKQPSQTDRLRAMVRGELLKRAAEEQGMETFEEADDFDVGDDYDPSSPYEEIFDPAAAAAAQATPLPTRPEPDAVPGEDPAEDYPPSKPVVKIGDKSWSGKSFKDMVDWIRRAPQEEVEAALNAAQPGSEASRKPGKK